MTDCIFCKIVAGDIPATKTYEDEKVIAFLDMYPKAPGHTLLIPRDHSRWFYDMPDDLSDHIFRVAKKLSLELKEKHAAEFVRLAIVGNEVPHTHLHLIPVGASDEVHI